MAVPGNIKPSLLWETGQPVFSTKIPCLAMASSSFSSGKSEDKAFGSTSVDFSFQNMTNWNSKGKPYYIYAYIYTYNIYNQTSYSIFAPHLKNVHSIYYDINNIICDLWDTSTVYTHTTFPCHCQFRMNFSFTRHLRLCSAATIRFHSILDKLGNQNVGKGFKGGNSNLQECPFKEGDRHKSPGVS